MCGLSISFKAKLVESILIFQPDSVLTVDQHVDFGVVGFALAQVDDPLPQ